MAIEITDYWEYINVHMAESSAQTQSPENWRDMSLVELAKSYVDFKIKEVRGKISSAQTSLKFHENYKPSQGVSRPSYVEAGSMDASDWDIAEYEDEHWEEERDEMIELYQSEVDELHDQFSQLDDDKDEIEDGDTALIGKYSALERERREKLEELQKNKKDLSK